MPSTHAAPGRRAARRHLRSLLLSSLALAAAQAAHAQSVPGASAEVRVFETVDPASGRRALHVLEGLSPAEVVEVQRALSRAGFGAPWREGQLDPFTRGALQRFQTLRGLAVCACVSLETLIELGLRTRVVQTIVLEEPPAESTSGRKSGYGEEGELTEAETSRYVEYANYYPYGVVYLVPFVPIHKRLPHGLVGGPHGIHAGRALAVPGFVGGAVVPAAGPTRGLMARPMPFHRVSPPPNVVRGS